MGIPPQLFSPKLINKTKQSRGKDEHLVFYCINLERKYCLNSQSIFGVIILSLLFYFPFGELLYIGVTKETIIFVKSKLYFPKCISLENKLKKGCSIVVESHLAGGERACDPLFSTVPVLQFQPQKQLSYSCYPWRRLRWMLPLHLSLSL